MSIDNAAGTANQDELQRLRARVAEIERAEAQLQASAQREAHRSNQLRAIADASLAIHTAPTLKDTLQAITDQARAVIGAHAAVTSFTVGNDWAKVIVSTSFSEKYAHWHAYDELPNGSGIYALVCRTNQSMRLTQAELEAHPDWRGFSHAAGTHPPLRGWLAVPLIGRDEHNLGVIQLSDKFEGEFTPDDEAMLTQLAQLASVAVENSRLYDAERQARTAAERAVRARDHMLVAVSHDLRTPLTVIKGHTQLLKRRITNERVSDPSVLMDSLTPIETTAATMQNMIEEILDITRLQVGQEIELQQTPADLVCILRERVNAVQSTTDYHLLFKNSVNELVGNWDVMRVTRVIDNLLSNAVKYGSSHPDHPTIVKLSKDTVNHSAVLTIEDRGIGIPAADLPHIFEPFHRASNVRQINGTGIGLAGVKQIVEMHGGTLSIKSREGQWTVVTVRLPLR